jgi:hypothetical protein
VSGELSHSGPGTVPVVVLDAAQSQCGVGEFQVQTFASGGASDQAAFTILAP